MNLKNLDIEKVAAAIEADADEAIPDLRKALAEAKGLVESQPNDRFSLARGKADVPWRTQDLMSLLRSED